MGFLQRPCCPGTLTSVAPTYLLVHSKTHSLLPIPPRLLQQPRPPAHRRHLRPTKSSVPLHRPARRTALPTVGVWCIHPGGQPPSWDGCCRDARSPGPRRPQGQVCFCVGPAPTADVHGPGVQTTGHCTCSGATTLCSCTNLLNQWLTPFCRGRLQTTVPSVLTASDSHRKQKLFSEVTSSGPFQPQLRCGRIVLPSVVHASASPCAATAET